jgi:Protein of unknown function (DUF1631)
LTEGALSSNDIINRCVHEAVALSRPMMGDLVHAAVAVMRARLAAETELPARMSLGEAADALSYQSGHLTERFPAVLLQAFTDALRAGATSAVKPATASALRFDQLELMDDEEVQGRIESARLQQSAMLSCERELAELDALVCTARGFATIQLDRNPFRPQIYGTAIAEVMAQTTGTAAQRLQWTQYVGAAVGGHLRKVYQQLADYLRSQQVKAATYAVTGSPVKGFAPSFERAVAHGGAQSESGEIRERADTTRLTVEQLRHVLGAEHFRHSSQQAHEIVAADPEDVMRDLDEVAALVQQINVLGSARAQQAPIAPDSELHTSRANALSVRESMEDADVEAEVEAEAVAQDVVRMMVDNLCDDHRLLPCVRDWVGSLEPPLLALVAVDASFLSDKAHPARKLLDEVTTRSLGFAAETAEGFADFFDPVLQACAELKPYAMPDAQAFVLAWQTVEHAWSKQKSAAQIHGEQAMQALLQAEQRNLLADKIALELTRRDDARQAPIFVKQFVAGPWSQVLAKARLSSQQVENAQTYLDAVTDLLWSAVPDQAGKSKQRLVRLIPGLLSKLRTGLATVGSPEHEGAAFFAQLMQVHEAALKFGMPVRGAVQPKVVATNLAVTARDAVAPALANHVDGAVWLAPQEARDSGFMTGLTDASQGAAPPRMQPVGYASESTPPTLPQSPAQLGDALITEPPTLGSWVELLSNERWVRAQLTWASPHGTLFMFTGAAGNPYSMTRRALDKMQARQTLRIIAQDSLVAGALNAVAQTALNNTVNTTSH